jgi:hypothetical protein
VSQRAGMGKGDPELFDGKKKGSAGRPASP